MAGNTKARISLDHLSAEDLASLKDELLKKVASRSTDPVAAAYGRHSNVHSSNSNAELAEAVRSKPE